MTNVRHAKILKWIPNEDIFSQMGFQWKYVKELPLSKKKLYREARLLRAENKSQIYFLNVSGFKKIVPDYDIFLSYGNKAEDVIVVIARVMDKLNISHK